MRGTSCSCVDNSDFCCGCYRYANRYPGCRCDLPSHVYQFSFAVYADWPEFYSTSAEINRYMHIVAQRFEIEPLIRLRHSVTSAVFDENKGNWRIKVENAEGAVEESEVDVFCHATGVLS